MNADKSLELARKAYPNNEELRVAYMLGLNEGYELHRDEMIKEAVEGEVVTTNKYTSVRYLSRYGTFRYFYGIGGGFQKGDNVRIVIIKED